MGRECWSWGHVVEGEPLKNGKGACRWTCKYCHKTLTGSMDRVRAHLAGGWGNQVRICSAPQEIPLEVVQRARSSFPAAKLVDNMLARYAPKGHLLILNAATCGSAFTASVDGSGTATDGDTSVCSNQLAGKWKSRDGDLHAMVDTAWSQKLNDAVGEFFYVENISFNTIRRGSLKKMLRAAVEAGPTGVSHILGYERLRTTQLQRTYESVSKRLEVIRKSWEKYGVSIVTDGWLDVQGCALINFMASSIHGSIFLKAVDNEGEEKTGAWLWDQLKVVIQDVREQNVVQVVTDNASNCVLMGELLEAKYPHILHTWCVCHVLDLLFEDIGGLQWVKLLVEGCVNTVRLITKKPQVLALYRTFCARALVKPVKTRFPYMFLVMSQLLDVNVLGGLRRMVVSEAWERLEQSRTREGQCLRSQVLNDSF